MNKQKMLELLSLAMDKQASIRIHFSQYDNGNDYKPITKDEAFAIASQFQEALSAQSINHEIGGAGTEHFNIDHEQFDICFSYIPGQSEKEETKIKRIEQLKQELAELENEVVRA